MPTHQRVTRPSRGHTYHVAHGRHVQGVFYVDGRRVLRGLGTLDQFATGPDGRKRTAAQVDREIQARWDAELLTLQEGHPESGLGATPISDVWDAWISASGDKAEGTRDYYERVKGEYLASAGDHAIGDGRDGRYSLVHLDALTTEYAERGLSVASIRIRLQIVKALLRWAYKRDYLPRVPEISLPTREVKLPRVLTEKQFWAWVHWLRRIRRWRPKDEPLETPAGKRYCPGVHQRWSAELRERFLRVGFDTGCRPGEIFDMEMDQFDDPPTRVLVEIRGHKKVKEKREKTVPLTLQLKAMVRAIRKLYPGERWLLGDGKGDRQYAALDSFTTMLARDMATLGFEGKGIKRARFLRALFAHRNRERGADTHTIKTLMGHRQISTTEGYFPASGTRERAAIAALERPVDGNLLEFDRARKQRADRKPKSDPPSAAS